MTKKTRVMGLLALLTASHSQASDLVHKVCNSVKGGVVSGVSFIDTRVGAKAVLTAAGIAVVWNRGGEIIEQALDDLDSTSWAKKMYITGVSLLGYKQLFEWSCEQNVLTTLFPDQAPLVINGAAAAAGLLVAGGVCKKFNEDNSSYYTPLERGLEAVVKGVGLGVAGFAVYQQVVKK